MTSIVAVTLILVAFASTQAKGDLATAKLLVAFGGKGTYLSIDVGAVAALTEKLKLWQGANADENVVLTSNSSGSILAVYFGCHGVSNASIDYVKEVLAKERNGISTALAELRENENPSNMMKALSMGMLPWLNPNNLEPYIKVALGVQSMDEIGKVGCLKPKIPFAVLTSNFESLDNLPRDMFVPMVAAIDKTRAEAPLFSKFRKAVWEGIPFNKFINTLTYPERALLVLEQTQRGTKGLGIKEISYGSFYPRWNEDAFHHYVDDPDGEADFIAENPFLKKPQKVTDLGKACTLFVTSDLFELLKKIPYADRQCDLREMTGPKDYANAIRYSASEPIYFPAQEESDYRKLLVGEATDPRGSDANDNSHLGQSKRRIYFGGFIDVMAARDLKRMLPNVYVFSTGVFIKPQFIRDKFLDMANIDFVKLEKHAQYWGDMVLSLGGYDELALSGKSKPGPLFEMGFQKTKACLNSSTAKGCLPAEFGEPDENLQYAAAGALDGSPNGVSAHSLFLQRGRGLEALY